MFNHKNKNMFTAQQFFKLKFLIIGVLTVGVLHAQNPDLNKEIPFNPNVKTGTLSNGLKYYIQKNAKPEKRVELRLAVNAGSILENDDQLGLAHFTEHMCFNGTKNFKKNDIVNYLQSIGVKFGADLNAYTSFDETVYILPIPSDDKKILDQGFQILEDWAHNVTFEDEEIDKERGVVIEEWRTGRGASQRMRDKYFPVLLKDSRYAQRLPIGTKEILESFKYETVKKFYKDWYRPDLMAVIVVGDIDIAEMEAKIKAHFGKIEATKNPLERKEYNIPDHKETLISIATDKEAPFTQVQLYYKHPEIEMKTLADYRSGIIRRLYNGMLNQRLEELSQSAEPPFIYGYTYYGGFIRSKSAYQSFASVSQDGIIKGLKALLAENQRVQEYGFNASELERYKKEILRSYEKSYNERDKTESANYVYQYINHFLKGEPTPGIEWEYDFLQKVLPSITVEEINQLPKKWISDENRVVIITAPDKEGVNIPTEEEIKAVLKEAESMNITAYEDKVNEEPLIAQTPKAGKVTKETKIAALGATELTLSNGLKVILKPTDFKNDEIMMTA